MAKIKRGSLVLPKGTTKRRVARNVRKVLQETGRSAAKDISIARKLKSEKLDQLADAKFYRGVARGTGGGVDYIDAMYAAKGSANNARKVGRKMTRVAEGAIEKIASAKALKRAARKAGVLGIVGMFLNEINSKKGKG